MYDEHAELYDLIYHFKDYKGETKKIRKLIKKYKRSTGNKSVSYTHLTLPTKRIV